MLHDSKIFFRRKFRKRRTQVESLSARAEHASERFFFKRLDRLVAVRRFVAGWLVLVALLCAALVGQIRALDGYFQTLQPTTGGIFTEGILGDFTNANPLYATNQVDESVSKLIFAGLFKYDDDNNLIGDLAAGYTVDPGGKTYTVTLKPGLTWHDGAPLTAEDVVFTYGMIQNPDALSVLNRGWQGITIAVVDPLTVSFTLPSVLGSFPYNMTNGIIPKHLLKDVAPSEMRSVSFNTERPVGAGPFAWQNIEVTGESPETRQSKIALQPFQGYHGGAPKLASFVVHAFHDAEQLREGFKNQELTAASIMDPPKDLVEQDGINSNSFMLSAANMVFFKHSNPVLADVAVRKALVQSVDVQAIIDSLSYPTHPVRGPFLLGQLGYDNTQVQPVFDVAAATAGLDAAGWKLGEDGVRSKAGVPLRFSLYGQDTAESRMVTGQLVKAWSTIGVAPIVRLQSSEDLQRSISSRDYDALLYGISVGVDPDVFVYWHGSQTDVRSSGLNFSEFKSKTADVSLEAGRTRIEPDLRVVKYKPFLQAWQQDVPALGLYQPHYEYLTHGIVYGMERHVLNTNTDRYNNVNNWQIREIEQTNQRPQ
ncbi:MAG TPA: peptide ABC transporter substrate-binding protein [Candidatus Saccharimonadales bacterium]|jgi:peptide/nickel transport system substrate-binding protein